MSKVKFRMPETIFDKPWCCKLQQHINKEGKRYPIMTIRIDEFMFVLESKNHRFTTNLRNYSMMEQIATSYLSDLNNSYTAAVDRIRADVSDDIKMKICDGIMKGDEGYLNLRDLAL